MGSERPTTIDCHNDWVLLFARERSLGNVDSLDRRFVPQFRDAGIDVQVTPIYIDPEFMPEAALRRTLLLIQQLKEEIAAGAAARVCRTGEEVQTSIAEGDLAILLALEGSHAIGTDVELFETFFELGLRMASFTHMGNTLLAGGSADGDPGDGLTRHGREALVLFEELGIVMDVSHLSVRSTEDVLQRATRPLVASHSSVRSIRDHHRNLTDEHAKAIAALGGVVCIPAAIPSFIDPQRPTLERVVDHVEHVVSLIGIDHVGIGADFIREYFDEVFPTYPQILFHGEDVRAVIDDFAGPTGMPKLVETLRQRGIDGADLAKVLGGNLLRVFGEVMGVGV